MKQTLKQKLQSLKYNQNQNLYNHLVKVFKKILLESPNDAYNLFEEYSLAITNTQLQKTATIKETYSEIKQYVEEMTKLLNKPNEGTTEEGEEPQEIGPTGYVPNIMQDSQWFETAGVGFGDEISYKIFKSLERFSITKNIQQLRFWGKIYAQGKDYYIAQGNGPAQQVEGGGAPEAEEPSADIQPRGQGINKKIYWVTTDLTSTWSELPTVTPQQMIISRKLKYIFTGDLESSICRNPHFPGKQSHLLKCQILRITASCTLIPKSMYKVQQQDPDSNENAEIQKTEQWKYPSFEFLTSLENWVHFPPNILKNGRLTHLPPPPPPQNQQEGQQEYDQQKVKKQIRQKDPFQIRLKSISDDKFNGIPGWKINVYGDSKQYRPLARQSEINFGFVAIKSNIWKGFTHIYHNKKYISIYIGCGFKASNFAFFPGAPEQILSQRKDQQQQPEPNFVPEEQPKKEEEEAPLQQAAQES